MNESSRLLADVVDSALRRGDAQTYVLGLTCRARFDYHSLPAALMLIIRTFLALVQPDAMEACLEEIENSFRNRTAVSKDVSASLIYYSMWAVVTLDRADLNGAYNFACEVYDLVKNSEATTFFSFDCYQG